MVLLDILSFVTSVGVGTIVESAIKKNTVKFSSHPLVGACQFVGGLVLTSMICDRATDYLEEKVNESTSIVANILKEEELGNGGTENSFSNGSQSGLQSDDRKSEAQFEVVN